jgi:hypothetical protein
MSQSGRRGSGFGLWALEYQKYTTPSSNTDPHRPVVVLVLRQIGYNEVGLHFDTFGVAKNIGPCD